MTSLVTSAYRVAKSSNTTQHDRLMKFHHSPSTRGPKKRNRLMIIILVWVILAFLAGNASGQGQQATAEIKNTSGQVVGRASFTEQSDGVAITLQISNLPPGRHGTHIHAVAKCDPPNFTSAGPHFNPAGKHHGLLNPQGPHAGDLPNLEVAADSTGRLEYTDPLVTLATGPGNSLFPSNGTSLVIHANPDDETSDPSGKSGSRIACGVILEIPPTFFEQYGLLIAAAVGIAVVVFFAGRRIRKTKSS